MFKKAAQRGRNEREGEAYRGPVAQQAATGESYVEPLRALPIALFGAMGAQTTLEAFFNILLGMLPGLDLCSQPLQMVPQFLS
jgi:hypothetical protein